jgi:hypothetical protein
LNILHPFTAKTRPNHEVASSGAFFNRPIYLLKGRPLVQYYSVVYIKAYYEKLRANNKKFKVAMVACMRKLLTILNAMVRDNRPWQPVSA